ncbi:MAG TPA: cache domain-containing protein [Ktedonobacteraceae bacterium]|nr:cache domain-containing protein [Ktedonobacteraceae bacterium]
MVPNGKPFPHRKLSFSLSVRVSGLLVLAAIIPLLVTVVIVELIARPTLITQASQEMQTDAVTHTQLIDSYFAERVLETEGLARLSSIQNFLISKTPDDITRANALAGLATGHGRGSFYEDWSVFDLKGNLRLSYPTLPRAHGQDAQKHPIYVLPSTLERIDQLSQLVVQKQGQSLISDVFYDSVTNEASIDIYSPIHDPLNYAPIGILRSTFDMRYIWDIVNKEAGVNGQGSYAMILDQHGVCIAYTNANPDPFNYSNSAQLFRSLNPPQQDFQQHAQQVGLYGLQSGATLNTLDRGPELAQALQNNATAFQVTPPGQQTEFQVVKSTTFTVPWTYLVLSPLNDTTRAADDQLRLTAIITLGILVLAAIIGLGIGRRITSPILRSVDHLRSSSLALKTLAAKEQNAATQQTWVVDSSQVGLRSVQYYTNAANQAIQRINNVGNTLINHWHEVDSQSAKTVLQQFMADTHYLERAIHYQGTSNQKLESAINVTVQVADQLAAGASSASEAATQLERVVDDLRQVVGK